MALIFDSGYLDKDEAQDENLHMRPALSTGLSRKDLDVMHDERQWAESLGWQQLNYVEWQDYLRKNPIVEATSLCDALGFKNATPFTQIEGMRYCHQGERLGRKVILFNNPAVSLYFLEPVVDNG